MKKNVSALLFALLFSVVAQAASLYILYDPACMDRLEYVSMNGDDKSEYIVYHVNTSPGVKVVLEVGPESSTSQDFPPAQVIKCNNAVFDEKLVNAINSNIERVFMVVKKGNNRYFISPITIAARYLRANDFILYDSPKYRFQFDTQMGTIGENIAYKNPKTEVYFEGMLENDCTGTLLFQQKAEFAGNPHSNIELIPEVGIIEERSGINAADAMRNVIRLEKVNGKKLAPYLRQLCKGIIEPEETEPAVAGASQQPEEMLTVGPRLETTIPKGEPTVAAPATASAAVFHTVKKGETLYRISKQYKVSVDQLRAWNSKGSSNTILVGEKLRVNAGSTPNSVAPTSTREGQIQILGSPQGFENTRPAAPQPTAGVNLSPRGSEARYHTVSRGETAASIAMRYGYTEKRFREFNNLGPNEMPKIGQMLKTSDCDCPQTTAAPIIQQQQSAPTPAYNPSNYGVIQSRIQQQSTGSIYTPEPTQPASPQEAFYQDDFNNSPQEYNYRNTPLFLDRPGASPTTTATYQRSEPAYRPPAPAYQPPATTTTPGREYSPQGDSYTITRNRINSSPTTEGNSGKGIISRSFSNRSPVQGETVQDYDAVSARINSNSNSRSSYNNDNQNRSVYVVKEGDTLYRIARMYGMTVERLRAINNLGPAEIIIPYQKILLN